MSNIVYTNGTYVVKKTRYPKNRHYKVAHIRDDKLHTHVKTKKCAIDLCNFAKYKQLPRHADLDYLVSLSRLVMNKKFLSEITEMIIRRTNSMGLKVVIITHIDLDGSGCEIILRKMYPNATVIRVNYGFEEDMANRKLIAEADLVFIVDMSVSKEFATLLDNTTKTAGKTVWLMDHHDSAIRKYDGQYYDWMILDTNRSGTQIVYDAFKHVPEVAPYGELARLVNDYDLWKHEDENSIKLQFLWSGLGKDTFCDRFLENPNLTFSDEETEVMDNSYNKYLESYEKALPTIEIYTHPDGSRFAYCQIEYSASLVASRILKENVENFEWLVCLNPYRGSLSFRSLNHPINQIAESLGGGGHSTAAGAPFVQFMNVPESLIQGKVVKFDFIDMMAKSKNAEIEQNSQSSLGVNQAK